MLWYDNIINNLLIKSLKQLYNKPWTYRWFVVWFHFVLMSNTWDRINFSIIFYEQTPFAAQKRYNNSSTQRKKWPAQKRYRSNCRVWKNIIRPNLTPLQQLQSIHNITISRCNSVLDRCCLHAYWQHCVNSFRKRLYCSWYC